MDPKQLHIDAALTNYAVKMGQGAMAAPRIFPILPVTKESDRYYVFGDEHISDDVLMPAAAGTPAGNVEWSKTSGFYSANEYKLKHLIPQRTIDNADPAANPQTRTTEVLRGKVMLAYERRVAALALDQNQYDAANKNAQGAAWSSGTSIEADIDKAREAVLMSCGYEANTIVIPPAVAKFAKRNPTLRALIQYTHSDLLVNGDLPPRIFNLDVVIPGARQQTANPGQTAAYSRAWGTATVLVAYVDPGANTESATLGLTWRVSSYGQSGERVRRWYDPEVDGWYIEYGMLQTEAIVSKLCGALIHTIT